MVYPIECVPDEFAEETLMEMMSSASLSELLSFNEALE
ncbi:hypothetical protein PF007_g7521 [Phytophthora fragariae]|uniref:Uncharacterized protein n=1 Tax=Phytophthora fragariae TaxID=53985 RepID=A0A6A4DN51_9STRA|nr:hypothetical protein PF003_g10878 [Phytophthora fragariae]KAE8943070.1 hypothetical protein PF009_g7180 [Phytophthora fragariae]KAE8966590.1 hypothetical protein PF011_g27881 [Phytophthora fragariae]KAE9122225.1 hypothetical protein PF007_g7521 [Phytophthora fragariae]KAE9153886.1 hypothetical protein PF006_g2024 [Phytophthora fragariae]